MQCICTASDLILKITLYDFNREIEYHKNEWGTVSREIIDKNITYQNPFVVLNDQEFNLIRPLSYSEYCGVDYKTFLIKNGLEHYLI